MLRSFLAHESGQGLVEYALILVLIAIVVIGILRALPINHVTAFVDLFGQVKRPSSTRMDARYSQPSLEPGS